MAELVDVGSIGSYFESLSDPRHERDRKHLPGDIAACGIICGCAGPTAIHRWAGHRVRWLSQHLAPPNGVPSRDCIRRLLIMLKPEAFRLRLQARIRAAIPTDPDDDERPVAIDGETCRGSHDRASGLGALHAVSARASEEGIAPGQVATDAESNEITAIPLLPGRIDPPGTLITTDATGCREEIAEQVVEGGGDCVVAVEGNQPKFLAAIETSFLGRLERDRKELRHRCHETREDGHGRVDERSYCLARVPREFSPRGDRPWVKAIGYSVRITQYAGGTESDEVRYYLSSRYLSGKRFGEAVRGHWGIESMHRVLDVNSHEDDSRTREQTLGNNLSWLRRFAVTLLKRHPEQEIIDLVGLSLSFGGRDAAESERVLLTVITEEDPVAVVSFLARGHSPSSMGQRHASATRRVLPNLYQQGW